VTSAPQILSPDEALFRRQADAGQGKATKYDGRRCKQLPQVISEQFLNCSRRKTSFTGAGNPQTAPV